MPADWRERLKFHAPDALAWRLLLLTFLFTVVVEILIIVPSAASFHERCASMGATRSLAIGPEDCMRVEM